MGADRQVRPLDAPAVVTVDMQYDILKGRLAAPAVVPHVPAVVERINAVLLAARGAGVPVIYSRIAFRQGHVDANPTSPARRLGYGLLEGDSGARIIDELRPAARDHLVTKRRTSVFFGTDFDILLRGLGIRTLIVTGATTNRAVESTIRDAHAHDYHAIVVSDATIGVSPELHEGSLRSIADFFGEVSSADEIVAALNAMIPAAMPGDALIQAPGVRRAP
jgi:nicotinamidase-related amidase